MVICLVRFQTTNTYVAAKNKIIIRYMYIYTRYARFFNACFACTSFSFVALSSLLRTWSSLCHCLSLFFLTFSMACQEMDHTYICQFINDHFIRNFNKFRNDEASKTSWGQSDTLDCHMGVTWFDAVRWLAASRRLIIFISKYYDLS